MQLFCGVFVQCDSLYVIALYILRKLPVFEADICNAAKTHFAHKGKHFRATAASHSYFLRSNEHERTMALVSCLYRDLRHLIPLQALVAASTCEWVSSEKRALLPITHTCTLLWTVAFDKYERLFNILAYIDNSELLFRDIYTLYTYIFIYIFRHLALYARELFAINFNGKLWISLEFLRSSSFVCLHLALAHFVKRKRLGVLVLCISTEQQEVYFQLHLTAVPSLIKIKTKKMETKKKDNSKYTNWVELYAHKKVEKKTRLKGYS